MGARKFKETKKVIRHIEESIKHWMLETYRRKIGASLQLLYSKQGSSRLTPRNAVCRVAYGNSTLRAKCDDSDAAMKLICNDNENHAAIGYRCHRDLSNIVIPHYDTRITRVHWYIFLGQFAIVTVNKCDNCTNNMIHNCRAYNDMFESYDIVQLKQQNIDEVDSLNESHVKSINERLLTLPPNRLAQDSILDISQVLSCHAMAIRFFNEEFARVDRGSKLSEELKAFASKFTAPPRKSTNKADAGADDTPLKPEGDFE